MGGAPSPTYKVWLSMLQRVQGKGGTAGHRQRYIGRNITVCKQWLHFDNFLADMGERPTGTSLDRIDNDGPYCRGNCRWATPTQQARNRHTNRVVEHGGQSLTIAEWAEITGIDSTTIRYRLSTGWPPDRALQEPVHAQHRRRAS